MSQPEKPSETTENRRFGQRRKPRGLGRVPRSPRPANVPVGRLLLDVSRSGARLLVRSELEKGALIYVALPWPDAARQEQEPMGASVAWCVAAANGGFCIGVQFHRLLSEEELRQVVSFTETPALPPESPSAHLQNQPPAPPL